jgi:hypothetical protein
MASFPLERTAGAGAAVRARSGGEPAWAVPAAAGGGAAESGGTLARSGGCTEGRSILVVEGGRARAATKATSSGEAAVRPSRGGLQPMAGDAPRGDGGPTVGAVAPRVGALRLAGASPQRRGLAAFGMRQPATWLLVGVAVWLPAAELVTYGAWL